MSQKSRSNTMEASSVIPAATSLNPNLSIVLNCLDVRLDEELSRYRRSVTEQKAAAKRQALSRQPRSHPIASHRPNGALERLGVKARLSRSSVPVQPTPKLPPQAQGNLQSSASSLEPIAEPVPEKLANATLDLVPEQRASGQNLSVAASELSLDLTFEDLLENLEQVTTTGSNATDAENSITDSEVDLHDRAAVTQPIELILNEQSNNEQSNLDTKQHDRSVSLRTESFTRGLLGEELPDLDLESLDLNNLNPESLNLESLALNNLNLENLNLENLNLENLDQTLVTQSSPLEPENLNLNRVAGASSDAVILGISSELLHPSDVGSSIELVADQTASDEVMVDPPIQHQSIQNVEVAEEYVADEIMLTEEFFADKTILVEQIYGQTLASKRSDSRSAADRFVAENLEVPRQDLANLELGQQSEQNSQVTPQTTSQTAFIHRKESELTTVEPTAPNTEALSTVQSSEMEVFGPNNYLESSEALLESLEDDEELSSLPSWMETLFTPLGLGSLLLLLLSSATLGLVVMDPSALRYFGLAGLFSDASDNAEISSETGSGENSEVQISDNPNAQEFIELDLNNLSTAEAQNDASQDIAGNLAQVNAEETGLLSGLKNAIAGSSNSTVPGTASNTVEATPGNASELAARLPSVPSSQPRQTTPQSTSTNAIDRSSIAPQAAPAPVAPAPVAPAPTAPVTPAPVTPAPIENVPTSSPRQPDPAQLTPAVPEFPASVPNTVAAPASEPTSLPLSESVPLAEPENFGTIAPERSPEPLGTESVSNESAGYRVVTPYTSDRLLDRAQQAVPDAYLQNTDVGAQIQFGAFENRSSAEAFAQELANQGIPVQIQQE